jgi:type IV fimbrial biogenesis protein FimT
MNRQSGFSLIELMIVVAITGVLLSLGAPAYQDFVRNQSRTAAVNDLISTLLFARSEAVARNARVSLCRSANPTAGTPTCATSGDVDWATGWIVWMDDDGDWARDSAEEIVRIGNKLANKSLDAETDAFAYRPNGRIVLSEDDEILTTTFTLCDDRGAAAARAVNITMPGRPEVGTVDIDGAALTC